MVKPKCKIVGGCYEDMPIVETERKTILWTQIAMFCFSTVRIGEVCWGKLGATSATSIFVQRAFWKHRIFGKNFGHVLSSLFV